MKLLVSIIWQPGWEEGLGENGYMYMYGWVPSLFTGNYHNIVLLISYTSIRNKKLKKRKRKETFPLKFPSCPVVRTPHSYCQGPRFNSYSRNWCPTSHAAKKKKRKKETFPHLLFITAFNNLKLLFVAYLFLFSFPTKLSTRLKFHEAGTLCHWFITGSRGPSTVLLINIFDYLSRRKLRLAPAWNILNLKSKVSKWTRS